MNFIDIAAFEITPVRRDPYDWLVVPNFVPTDALRLVSMDFPDVPGAGSHPPSAFRVDGAFEGLVSELLSPRFRRAVEEKFDINLDGRPAVYTLRGYAAEKDGAIHTDSKSKIVTVLLYLNESWEAEGGRIRILRNGHDLDNFVAEAPPHSGALFAFKRSEKSWHGHKRYVGRRRVLQLNWVADSRVARREQTRHSLTHFLKRVALRFGGSAAAARFTRSLCSRARLRLFS